MDSYNNALATSLRDRMYDTQLNQAKKARDEAITNATGVVDTPISTELIKNSVTSKTARNLLKNTLKKYTGLEDDEVEKLVTSVQKEGTKGLQDSLTDLLNNRTGNALNKLGDVRTTLREQLSGKVNKMNELSKSLTDKKNALIDEFKEKTSNLKTELNNKLEDISSRRSDIQSQIDGLNSEPAKEALRNKLSDLDNEESQVRGDYGEQLKQLNKDGIDSLKEVQDSINESGNKLLDMDMGDLLGNRVSSIAESVMPTIKRGENALSGLQEQGQQLRQFLSSPERMPGQDSTLARALTQGKEEAIQTANTGRLNAANDFGEVSSTIRGQAEQASENIIPKAEEQLSDIGESVGKTTAKSLLKTGLKNAGIDVGEEVGESVGEGIAEFGLGDIIPGLGALIGLGTMGAQIGESIKQAKKHTEAQSILNPTATLDT